MAQDLKKQVSDILLGIEGEVGTALNIGLEESAKDIAAKTRDNALALWPNSKTGYPKNWTYQKDKVGSYVVYNKKTYQLAHLLNNGHRIINNGKFIGMTKAKPHIPTQEEADKITTEIVERRLNQI